MSTTDYMLDLDRNLPQTMHEQARNAIMSAIRTERPGFCVGDRLITQELSRQNAIHRNTLANAMSDLVRLGFLRRIPNKGFEVVKLAPERPQYLTRHILSLTEVAQRDDIDSQSLLISAETGCMKVGDLAEDLRRVGRDLGLGEADDISVIARCRLMKKKEEESWDMVAVEQSFICTALTPGLLEAAIQEIEISGDFSIYRQLHRIFPNDEFFKAHYEITIAPLPKALAASWKGSTESLIAVVSITYCSHGPIEMTRTWFDASQATLLAGSLDVKL
jgi:DNA-binding GntR family transcriptional regulator